MFNKLLILFYDGSTDAAIIAGSSQIASSAIGAMAQSNLNNKTKDFDREMYARQRADALSDWERNNAYNSPEQQMERFKSANLNPNLIYGNNSTNAAPIRSSTPLSWNPKAPDYSGIAAGIGNAFSVKLQQAQLDNLEAQNHVIMQDAALKASQKASIDAAIPKIGVDTQSAQFDLQMKQSLQDITRAKSVADLQQVSIGNDYTISRNEREAALNVSNLASQQSQRDVNAMTLKTAAQNILNMRLQAANTAADLDRIKSQIQSLNTSSSIGQADLQLKQNGIQPTDNLFWRIIGMMIGPNTVKGIPGALAPKKGLDSTQQQQQLDKKNEMPFMP